MRRMEWVWDVERYWWGVERAQKSTTWVPWGFVMWIFWWADRCRAVPVEAGRVWVGGMVGEGFRCGYSGGEGRE